MAEPMSSVIPGMANAFQSQEAPSIARTEALREQAAEAESGGTDTSPPAVADDSSSEPASVDAQPDAAAEGEEAKDFVPDPESLMKAAVLGLTYEDAKAFGSNEALAKHMELMTRLATRPQAQQQAPAGFTLAQQPEQPAQPPAPVQWYEMPDLSEYGIDESVTKAIAGMNDHNKKAFTGLMGEVQAMRQLVAAQAQQVEFQRMAQTEAQFEQAVNAMNEPWAEEALGKGEAEDIKPEQLQNRIKLFDAMMRLAAVQGSEKKSPRRLVLEAVGLVPEFRSKIAKAGKQEIVAKVNSQGKIRRPNLTRASNAAPQESPLEFARRAVAERTGKPQTAQAFIGAV